MIVSLNKLKNIVYYNEDFDGGGEGDIGISSDSSTTNEIRSDKHIDYVRDLKKKKKIYYKNKQLAKRITPKNYLKNKINKNTIKNINENTKFTLTLKQIKELVNESKKIID